MNNKSILIFAILIVSSIAMLVYTLPYVFGGKKDLAQIQTPTQQNKRIEYVYSDKGKVGNIYILKDNKTGREYLIFIYQTRLALTLMPEEKQ